MPFAKYHNFDKWGHQWRASQKGRLDKSFKFINNNIDLKHPKHKFKVLDLGCGKCDSIQHLDEIISKYEYYGIDKDEYTIDNNRRNLNFKCSRIENLDFDFKFNLIICLEALYYLSSSKREKCVERISRIMNKESLLIVSSFLSNSKNYFTNYDLCYLFTKSNFEIKKISFINNKFYSNLELKILNWALRPCYNLYRSNWFDFLYIAEMFNIYLTFYTLKSKILYMLISKLSKFFDYRGSQSHILVCFKYKGNN